MDNNALGSMMTVIDFPNKKYLKYSADVTTPNNSTSLTLYRFSLELRNCDANSTVCQIVGDRCSNAAPKLALEASHLMRFPRLHYNLCLLWRLLANFLFVGSVFLIHCCIRI